jgi:primosomal protein N'
MADCERQQPGEARRVRVLVPVPLPAALDYLVPPRQDAPAPGTFVIVGLGPRKLAGIVWDGASDEVPAERLKPVLEILPTPALSAALRRFVERVAAYTMASPGAVLRMVMSVPDALRPPRARRLCAITDSGRAALAQSSSPADSSGSRRPPPQPSPVATGEGGTRRVSDGRVGAGTDDRLRRNPSSRIGRQHG